MHKHKLSGVYLHIGIQASFLLDKYAEISKHEQILTQCTKRYMCIHSYMI